LKFAFFFYIVCLPDAGGSGAQSRVLEPRAGGIAGGEEEAGVVAEGLEPETVFEKEGLVDGVHRKPPYFVIYYIICYSFCSAWEKGEEGIGAIRLNI
jgi:hypothetical protein